MRLAAWCCACASTRNTSRSSAQERVEEQAESERQISTQEQAEEQRDVVTISKTTTETKSTTTIYDTSSPAADSLESRRPADDHNGNETTNTTATVDKSVIRQIVDEQLREAANEQTTTNKQEDTGTEEIKEDSTPKNLRWLGIIAICATVIMGCFFVLRFVGRK